MIKNYLCIYSICLFCLIFLKIILYYLSSDRKNFLGHVSYVIADLFLFLPIITYFIIQAKDLKLSAIGFFILNTFILVYFFIRFRLPGKAWELVLTNKHTKNLDTFMVVIGLIFASAFGAITSFEIKVEYFFNIWYLMALYFVFISINIVIMTIMIFISTYVINVMGNRKVIMLILVIFIGIGVLLQETMNYGREYEKFILKKEKKEKKCKN